MVTNNSHGPAQPVKMPFESLTEQLAHLQQEVAALRTQQTQERQTQDERITGALRTLETTLHQSHTRVLRGIIGLAGVGLVYLGVGVWWMRSPATPNYIQAFLAVDRVLVQHYGSLPKAVQDGPTGGNVR